MGFFDSNISNLDKKIRELINSSYEYKNKLNDYDFSIYIDKFRDEEILTSVLTKLSNHNMDFSLHLDYITDMYTSICSASLSTSDKQLFTNMIDLYIDNQELFINNHNFEKVFCSFSDKRLVYEYFKYLSKNENIIGNNNYNNISILVDYVGNARQYYVDDRALLASALTLIRTIDSSVLKYGDISSVQEIVNTWLANDKKTNGIYDIDESKFAELDSKMQIVEEYQKKLNDLITLSSKQQQVIQQSIDSTKRSINDISKNTISEMQIKANQIIKDFESSYLEMLSQEKDSLEKEKDLALQDVTTSLAREKSKLEALIDVIGKRVSSELNRINNYTDESLSRLKAFVEDNDAIKEAISEAKTNEDLLRVLNEYIKAGSQSVEKSSNPTGVVAQPLFFSRVVDDDREVDLTVNYFFNEDIPFSERFKKLTKLKEEDIKKNNSIYHEMFDDIAKIVMVGNKPPYLIGPSGSGKTYLVENQLANLLGLNVVTDSYITFEQAILGYTNSGNGAYVPSNFYRCYKYGDIYFLDELDNGIANATIVLNKFMGNGNSQFTFPDGVKINRHPNFRIITAGNTNGNGRTSTYNTRVKLDESTLQRMTPVQMDYDDNVEMRILKDYSGWYNFAVNFRKALQQVPTNGESVNSAGTFTTRDAESIKKYLDNKVFDDSKIMLYEIVGTKDIDYLAQIGSIMKNQSLNSQGRQLLDKYFDVCEGRKVKCKTLF